ncbi:hypothetical protein IKG16_00770, partial [Candidatus Saccharibacteria bacterium]|nr:hypothetical protein [Candidatus Saccharibacteria bacterium]
SEYTSTDQSIQNTNKYASVPTSGNEVLLTQDTTGTSSTTIYYGVLADRDIPAGSYGNTVLYTALAEQPSEIRVTSLNASTGTVSRDPAVIDISSTTSLHSTVTIYTSINTASDSLGTASVVFKDNSNNAAGTVEDTNCTNPVVSRDSDNYLYITCTSPAMPVGTYDVEVTLDTFGRVLTASRAIEYSGTPMIQSITTMQQMTTDICKTMPIGQTVKLKDTRGRAYAGGSSDTYNIVKAKDNHCWMAENFDLYNKTVAAADSDFTSGTYTLPASSDWNWGALEDYSTARIHRPMKAGYTGQIYYNWCAATALSECSTTIQAQQSVCPKNWTLPSKMQYQTLMNTYSLNNGTDIMTGKNGSSILGLSQYFGIWGATAPEEQGQGAYTELITATPSTEYKQTYPNNSIIYLLQYDSDKITMLSYWKNNAYPFRCIAR